LADATAQLNDVPLANGGVLNRINAISNIEDIEIGACPAAQRVASLSAAQCVVRRITEQSVTP
jgi:hypothetical protein